MRLLKNSGICRPTAKLVINDANGAQHICCTPNRLVIGYKLYRLLYLFRLKAVKFFCKA